MKIDLETNNKIKQNINKFGRVLLRTELKEGIDEKGRGLKPSW